MSIKTHNPHLTRAWLIFILASSFYLYEFLLQVSLGVMTTDLMRDFQITAAGLGSMGAFFFYSYSFMQIPAGMLFDRYGPRLLISIAIIIVALGTYAFSLTNSLMMASFGRLFMGVGSAFSFIGILVLVSRWFKPIYFATLVGIAQFMASIGAMVGGAPLSKLINAIGWRDSVLYLAFIGTALMFLMWLIIRDAPPQHRETRSKTQAVQSEWANLQDILRNPQTWAVAFYAFLIWAPIVVFAVLWGVPFAIAHYELSNDLASFYVSLIWLGVAIGCPFFGALSDRLKRRNLPMTLCALIGLIGVVIVLFLPVPVWLFVIALFFIGAAAAGQTISFAVVKDINPPHYVGTACGFNNMATVAGGAVFNPIVGLLLTVFWSGQHASGVPVYSLAAYQKALAIIPVCYVLALFVNIFLIKETYAQQTT